METIIGNIDKADIVWILVAAALVFVMQFGFLCLEVGYVRPKAATITALKNVVDWLICVICFSFVGWGIMFGHSDAHNFNLFGLDGFNLQYNTQTLKQGLPIGITTHFLFELVFAGTAATIVSGALAERASFYAYMCFSAVITAIIYPIAGHWIWGGSFFPSNTSHMLLAKHGFIDFAGSTMVHSIGGWCSLVGVMITGARLGRFGPQGEVRYWPVTGIHFSALGLLLLWFAWWGFNGGSVLRINGSVGQIIINTNLGGAFGGVGALLYRNFFEKREGISGAFLNGILGGLVAITASCFMVNSYSSVAIGFIAGIICTAGSDLLLKLKLDDPVGAIPAHLFCGIWGTLCVAIFGKYEIIQQYAGDRLTQFFVQIVGIIVVGIWCVLISGLAFYILKRWVGLRVSPYEEMHGYDIAGVLPIKPTEPALTREELRALFEKNEDEVGKRKK